MTDQYIAGIRAIDGLEVWAEPDLTLINFGSNEFDIYLVAEKMNARGWLAGLTSRPKGMYAMMSMLHEPARAQFLPDLAECVEMVRNGAETQSDLKAVY